MPALAAVGLTFHHSPATPVISSFLAEFSAGTVTALTGASGERAGHRPGGISGGQAQRVALCRALINNPSILADEPTGNLDRQNADVVSDILFHAAHTEDSTVVIATHDPPLVKRCDATVSP